MPRREHPTDSAERPRPVADWGATIAQVVLVAAVFAILASWPVPDVNEAHYLGKARRLWQPDWAPHDFFFETADGHPVFTWTIGWLAFLPDAAYAWSARLLVWIVQAAGWCRLWNAVSPRRWYAPLSAGLFVALAEQLEMAGEWAVGGAEAKCVAYGLVFFALAALARGRWNAAWCWLGAASGFHVLVGGWSAIAAAGTWLLAGKDRPAPRSMVWGLSIGALLSAPGLWSALALSWNSDAELVATANGIYVHGRLAHHLDPAVFLRTDVARFVGLSAVWLAAAALAPRAWLPATLRWFVTATLGISLAGMCVSLATAAMPDWRAALLKFYWFRLSDVMVPLGVSLLATSALSAPWQGSRARWARISLAVAVLLVGLYAASRVWQIATAPSPRSFRGNSALTSRALGAQYADWRNACAWIAEHSPRDARFLTPRMESTFKWFAGRSEVVTWKDVPQDAESLVEWQDRLHAVYLDRSGPRPRWHASLAEASPDRLRVLGRTYQAQYLLVEAEPRLALDVVYQNNSYAVYRLEP